ncbi:MAG: DNA translocase FtsK [Phycisphaerales bacterium]|nr:MAG: DNA translocase FtsK [Phycisphaerales bacterium]
MGTSKQRAKPRRILTPLLLLLLCAFAWAALLSFDVGDWPSSAQYPHNDPSRNACGPAGAVVAVVLLHYLGDGAYPLLVFATMGAGLWLVHGYVVNLLQRVFGLALLAAGTAATVHLMFEPGANTLPVGPGGVIGCALGDFLAGSFSRLGTGLILAWGLIVGLLFTAEGWVLRLPDMVKRVGRASGEALAAARVAATADPGLTTANASATAARRQERDAAFPTAGEPRINVHRPKPKPRDAADPRQGRLFEEGGSQSEPDAGAGRGKGETSAKSPAGAKAGARAEADAGHHEDPMIRAMEAKKPPPPKEAYPRQLDDWTLPDLSLLADPEYAFTAQHEAQVRAKGKTLEQTLDEFGLDARVVEIDTGPVITMFELRLAPGIKVSQVATLANDIARALRAPAVRVVAPLPGKNTIGIEVPNLDKEIVRLKELMTLASPKTQKMGLPVFIGKDVSGAALIADLTAMPHLLIAGTTGSGKSVCINAIIASILMTKRPDHVKLILVDPKMVELSQFKEVPHLMCPIVNEMQRAEAILEWAVTKMDERYELLAEARVRNVTGYNKLTADEIYERFQPTTDEERAQIPTRLPYIVIVIDELADLMMTSAHEVEHHLSRLAQKSRAVGIHIVVATQRPEVKVVTGLIKSNLPCRIAFRVASRMDSRIVLDQNGAEVLMGQGDMLFLPPGTSKLIRAQGTFVDEVELHNVIQWLRDRAEPQFHPELLRVRPKNIGSPEERDVLFDDAVRVVLDTQRGSVSLLQRRLGVGYARASRLIEQMSDAGIVGDYKGSQAREVIMTLEEYEELCRQMVTTDEEDLDAKDDTEEDEEEEEDDEYDYAAPSERA